MHHSRLVGGPTVLAVLLVLIVGAPAALAAHLPPQNPKAVGIATRCIGVPYVSGGTSLSGLDSPGFTRWVFRRIGVWLPDDLVFFGSASYSPHVGIYIGKGMMIDAPHTGAVVSRSPIAGAWIGGRLLPVR
ncbi:MAG: NlpC/P60 family protein [Actinomycetes bacterium]